MDESKRRLWAEFRFAVIAPLVCRRLDEAERRQLRSQILRTRFDAPDGTRKFIHERTLRAWVARYRLYGLDGLMRLPSAAKGTYRAIAGDVLTAAVGLRRELRTRSVRGILSVLRAKGLDVGKISKSTLNFHLNRLGATKEKYASEKGTFQRFQKEHANELWQADCSGGIWLPDPYNPGQAKLSRLISFIDDATRVVTHAAFYWDEQLPSLFHCLRKALLMHGKPHQLYSDNGPSYRSKALFRTCANLGIELLHAEEYTPEGKGKIEKHIGTLKAGFYSEAEHSGLTCLEDLNAFFFAWLDKEYHNHNHTALGMTPAERWQQDEVKGFIEPVMPEAIRRALMLCDERRVNRRTALVHLNNRTYQASPHLAGKTVEVQWEADRNNPSVEIWFDGKLVEIAQEVVPGSNIDYEKRPDRQRKPAGPTVLSSSKEYRLALVGSHTPRSITKDDYLAEVEFQQLIAGVVQRELTQEELSYLSGIFARLAPLRSAATQSVLRKAVEAKGANMHVRYYCALLEQLALTQRR